jgi:hypothetical protein
MPMKHRLNDKRYLREADSTGTEAFDGDLIGCA